MWRDCCQVRLSSDRESRTGEPGERAALVHGRELYFYSPHQQWTQVAGETVLHYAGHEMNVADLRPSGLQPHVMDTPSTKDKVDKTTDY